MTNMGLLVLRVSIGMLMIIGHGWPKLNKLLSREAIQFPDPIGIGSELSFILVVFAEFFCSILLILGTLTRAGLIPLIKTMVVAIFIVKAGKPLDVIELPVLFLIIYVSLFLSGPGKYALSVPLTKKSKFLDWITR